MKTYREIYDNLTPRQMVAWLREAGVPVPDSDAVEPSRDALLVHYAERLQELEARIVELEGRMGP